MRSCGAILIGVFLAGFAIGSRIMVSAHEFQIAPDVTLDSIVQVGDGPQELSTEIKFYPNTRRVGPGETVYWTLDLGDLAGPFSVIPEMDDDGQREKTIRPNESMVVIVHTCPKTLVRVDFNIALGQNPGVKVKGQIIICT